MLLKKRDDKTCLVTINLAPSPFPWPKRRGEPTPPLPRPLSPRSPNASSPNASSSSPSIALVATPPTSPSPSVSPPSPSSTPPPFAAQLRIGPAAAGGCASAPFRPRFLFLRPVLSPTLIPHPSLLPPFFLRWWTILAPKPSKPFLPVN
ncbi:hypothetical protein O6H91_07G032800 [Diphasiastrum complanatum]|uniref:Uncharacterized protein n=1 Tax=Diphasiastrum complanatum TaxID=34168 RepID=A0ACC2D3S6_DIPCM|nr:hypothetical protein O6H91_07G032800 [Diphasiastrum complanatum]